MQKGFKLNHRICQLVHSEKGKYQLVDLITGGVIDIKYPITAPREVVTKDLKKWLKENGFKQAHNTYIQGKINIETIDDDSEAKDDKQHI